MSSIPLESVVEEGQRISDAAQERRVELRILGGVAIWMHCPGSHELLSNRRYGDVDLVGTTAQADEIDSLFQDIGYEPNWTFNRLHKGEGRLMFFDTKNERRVDIFLDAFSMCHSLDLRDRLSVDHPTLCLADLALTKLQVFEITEKDLTDLSALFEDHPVAEGNDETIDVERIIAVCSADWGWYRTVKNNLQRLATDAPAEASGRAAQLIQHLDEAPKSSRWKLRAMVGERVQWYQLPEEV